MPYRRTLAIAIAIAGYFILLAVAVHGPWDKLANVLGLSNPPAPFYFESLKGHSDDEIASFMSGTGAPDHFHPADAPDNHFPESLWDTGPKSAALAFADANRTPGHRKIYCLTMEENPAIKAPDAGWVVLDDFHDLTAMRFGVEQSFLFHVCVNYDRSFNNNPYTDRSSRSLQIIPLTPDEARFLAHTVFWLEHIQSERNQKGFSETHTISTHEGFGVLDWLIDKQAPRQISETLWSFSPISCRWRGEYDTQTYINLTHHLLAEALPRHLGKRWNSASTLTYTSGKLPLTDRPKPHEDKAARKQLTDFILSGIDCHTSDPWPAAALTALAESAGNAGLTNTLPALEKISAQPENGAQSKLRQSLNRAILQLRALDAPAQLVEMAKSDTESGIWALHQLELRQPELYADALTARFHRADRKQDRVQIFNTLATANPPATRRLRDALTEKELADFIIEITRFEITDDPANAITHIPALLEILTNPDQRRDWQNAGQSIDLLAKLPLDKTQQTQFERQLLSELLEPRHKDFTIRHAVAALLTRADPDRYWDTLIQSGTGCTDSYDFQGLLDGLANLALAKPEPRLSQLTDFLRSRLSRHTGSIDDLSIAALALDLRPLEPELSHLATSSSQVPDGEYAPKCNADFETPCLHRYHSARHVLALWIENDADTRARMWTALLLHSTYKFVGTETIPSSLRNRCRAAINAASPELRKRLIAQAHSNPDILRELPGWLADFQNTK